MGTDVREKHTFLEGGKGKKQAEGTQGYAKNGNQEIKISEDLLISLIRLDAKWPFRL